MRRGLKGKSWLYEAVHDRIVAIVTKIKVSGRPLDSVGDMRPEQGHRRFPISDRPVLKFEPPALRPSHDDDLKSESSNESGDDLTAVSLWPTGGDVR